MEQVLLGIDNGGTVAKAAVFDCEGRELAVASCKNRAVSPRPGWVEFDAESLWLATASAIRQVIDRSRLPAEAIAAVACAGHGNGLYLVDPHGSPVRHAIFSSDSRAAAIVERWLAEGIDRRVRPKTMQSLWPGQPNALLAWLRDHEPETLAAARWALMCKDYIRFRLTGEAFAEITDASGTSLIDVARGEYDPGILEAFGLAGVADKLPPLRRSAEVCGQVTAAAAEQTGLPAGTPVAGGLFDVDACAVASALLDESRLGITLGTWGIHQYVSTTPVVEGIFMTSRYCVPGYFLMLEGSATSAGNLEWFLRNLPAAAAAAAGDSPDPGSYGAINAAVAAIDPGEACPVFLPFLYGSNADPRASACLVGIREGHNQGHLLRGIFEGVVFAHRAHWDRLLEFRDPPEAVRVSGGAARSDVWMQILADVLSCPLEVPEGSELGALGAAICAGVAAGCHASFADACGTMVRIARTFQPEPSRAEIYETKLVRYRKTIETLAGLWHDID